MIAAFALLVGGAMPEWEALPKGTPIPPMLLVCRLDGEARPNFKSPWWQIAVAHDGDFDRVKIYQVGDGHVTDQASLQNALTSYEVKKADNSAVWRVTYQSGATALQIQLFSPASADGVASFVWTRPHNVMRGFCDSAPPGLTPGWERNPGIWE